MITPKKLSTIAQEYTPDLLNSGMMRLLDKILIIHFLFKNELLAAENHPEWFLKLLNFSIR